MPSEDELELDVDKGSSKGKGKLIVIIIAALLLAGGGTGAALYFAGVFDSADGGDEVADETQAETELAKPPATFYLALDPEFVVNFEDQGVATYLQVGIQLMAHDQAVLSAVQHHMPAIRNNILLLMSNQKYTEMKTTAGKEKLRQEILETVQQVLAEEAPAKQADEQPTAGTASVDAVYFTSFIMQ